VPAAAAGKIVTRVMKTRFLLYPFAAAAIFLSSWLIMQPERQWENVELHSTMEAVEALSALLMAVFLLGRSGEEAEDKLAWPALGFLGMGILNIAHAASPPGVQLVFLRAAASLGGGLGFALVWLPPASRAVVYKARLAWLVVAGALLLCMSSFLIPSFLPAMTVDSEFTTGAVAINLAAGLLFLAGTLRLALDLRSSGRAEDLLLSFVGLFFGLSGLTFNFSTLWSESWWLWHVLRLIASLLLLSLLIHRHLRTVTTLRTAVAELKQAEEERERLIGEIVRSNKELEQFAYIASHDLTEPLRMVTGYVQLLAKRYKGQLDDKADQYIHFAVDGVLRMQQLIEGLLAYSRITRAGAELKPVDCNTVFTLAVANLTAAIEEKRAKVTKDELPVVSGDETQLIRLMQNLIANAIKFGRPDIPPQVHVSAHCGERAWIFAVRDNGIGMEPQYFEQIFLIFQRLHTRSQYPGTGIGLAVCKKIVEQHHGRIWVESTPGKGSTFYFTLPGESDKT